MHVGGEVIVQKSKFEKKGIWNIVSFVEICKSSFKSNYFE